jgi:Domain of Unknown Function (DUF1080)
MTELKNWSAKLLAIVSSCFICSGYAPAAWSATFEEPWTSTNAWGGPNANIRVEKGGILVLKPTTLAMNLSNVYKNMDATIDVKIAATDANQATYTGLAFWGEDTDNYYTFTLWSNGKYGLARTIDNKASLIGTQKVVVTNPLGTWHTLRVTTEGDKVTCYMDGKQVVSYSGQHPVHSHIAAIAGNGSPSTDLSFKSLKVNYE